MEIICQLKFTHVVSSYSIGGSCFFIPTSSTIWFAQKNKAKSSFSRTVRILGKSGIDPVKNKKVIDKMERDTFCYGYKKKRG